MTGIPVAGLAKENEWLYLPGHSEPIVLPPNSPALHLVMRVRDEAHRFAVTYHRQRRDKAMTNPRSIRSGARPGAAQAAADGVRFRPRSSAPGSTKSRRSKA